MERKSQKFLSQLQNFEKQRDKNLFQNYSLEFLEKVWKELGLDVPSSATKISIVGTNGKGSTAFFLANLILQNSLGKVGIYTSPHLITERERIQIDGNYFNYEDLEVFLASQSSKLPLLSKLSYFEFLTLFAMDFFRKNACKFEIYEAGLGGRLDATKLAKAEYIVVTKIGLDHTEILGDTKEKILQEKLEIATENSKALFYFPQNSNSLDEQIESFCFKRNLRVYRFSDTFQDYLSFNFNYSKFILEKITSKPLENLRFTICHGRMEIISENPLIVFDVGHNPDAILFLLNSLEKRFVQKEWNILFGCLPNKDAKAMLEILESWKYTKQIYVLNFPPFAKMNFEYKGKEISSLEDFYWKKALLVVGSFRLYEFLPKLKKSL